MLYSARDNLFMLLTALTNRGINLWCVTRFVQPLSANIARYALPVGTVDILRALLRSGTYTAATSLAAPSAVIDYGAATVLAGASVTVGVAGSYALVLESSDDNVNWVQRGTANWPSAAVGAKLGIETVDAVSAQYWRVRETVLVANAFTSGTFVSAATVLPMSLLARDDYSSYPNPQSTNTQPLQAWYDKQSAFPYLQLWPAPNADGQQLVIWAQRQIQDVGALSNTIEVPQRWYLAIIFELAKAIHLELPKELVIEGRYQILKDEAERYTREAEDGERDGAPVRFSPNISPYTR